MNITAGIVTVAVCATVLASCAPAVAAPTDPRPVTEMLAAVTLNGANEADALAIANGLCLRLNEGWALDEAGDEWIAVGWDASLVASVAASVDAHPLFCETMAPAVKQVTMVG